MTDYPKRPPHYDRMFRRALIDRHAANTLGAVACWLLEVVVDQEDRNRYSGPVTYYNGVLMGHLGLGSEDTLARARRKAIDGGWLQYDSGGKGMAGAYFVTIPTGVHYRTGAEENAEGTADISAEETGGQVRRNPEDKCGDKCGPFLPKSPGPDPGPSVADATSISAGLSPAVESVGQETPKRKRKTPPKEKKPREPDALFDAIAMATGMDPGTAGSQIGKASATLRWADQPYTADDVRQFARRFLQLCPWAVQQNRLRPTIGEVEKYIGYIRSNPEQQTQYGTLCPQGSTAPMVFRSRLETPTPITGPDDPRLNPPTHPMDPRIAPPPAK